MMIAYIWIKAFMFGSILEFDKLSKLVVNIVRKMNSIDPFMFQIPTEKTIHYLKVIQ
jgi:hypothetical protein